MPLCRYICDYTWDASGQKKKKSKYLCRSRCMDWNCEFHRNKELCCEETCRVKKKLERRKPKNKTKQNLYHPLQTICFFF